MKNHIPVLLNESIDYLIQNNSGIYVDCTMGFGGHLEEILKKIKSNSKLIGIDKDISSFKYCKSKFHNDDRVVLYNTSFVNIDKIAKIELVDKIDGIFADLGVSSFQLDNLEEGFSYRFDSDLDLRMDKSSLLKASDVIMTQDEKTLADIFWKFGEERNSRLIARKIVESRKYSSIRTTFDLRKIVEESVPSRFLISTLSRIFQALRIYVNNELEELEILLKKSIDLLSKSGRLVLLSYHSLEDRIIKDIFKYEASDCVCPIETPICNCNKIKRIEIITKKPVVPTDEEIKNNNRARSAKLRVAKKL
ncbi:MAG: 16S rRNA (cytosine(1402)-N(4))-methyltransferase RsmH [Ignavibacteriales bacterium]|nr:16S rRNA (cytosine(1402)-N(4))-methyltransferase RsmH [Ignavibacteriales bacterium]